MTALEATRNDSFKSMLLRNGFNGTVVNDDNANVEFNGVTTNFRLGNPDFKLLVGNKKALLSDGFYDVVEVVAIHDNDGDTLHQYKVVERSLLY